jgi:hypothetical protein
MDVLRTKRGNVFETALTLPGRWGEPSSDYAVPTAAGYSVSELSQQDTWSLNTALQTDLSSSGLPSKISNAFLIATMRPTCSDHLTLNSTPNVKLQAHSMHLRPSPTWTGPLRKRNKNYSPQRHPEQTAVCSTSRTYQNVHLWYLSLHRSLPGCLRLLLKSFYYSGTHVDYNYQNMYQF